MHYNSLIHHAIVLYNTYLQTICLALNGLPHMTRNRRPVILDLGIKHPTNLQLRAGVKHMTEYVLYEKHYLSTSLTNHGQARFGILKMLLAADPTPKDFSTPDLQQARPNHLLVPSPPSINCAQRSS